MSSRAEVQEAGITRDLLLLVSIRVSVKAVLSWTPEARAAADRWAAKSFLRANDNIVRVPPKPAFLNAYPKLTVGNRLAGTVL